jgi:hypothetical protein
MSVNFVRVLTTRGDGCHIYIDACDILPNQTEKVDIYAFFISRDEGQKFKSSFNGQSVSIKASAISFTKGIGGEIKIVSWSFA